MMMTIDNVLYVKCIVMTVVMQEKHDAVIVVLSRRQQ